MLALSINARRYELDADPATPLLWVLRDVLHLTGTKFGCGAGQCWSCAVLVDGKARPSCTLTIGGTVGRDIVTIEGIAEDHPVKRAWVEEQVPQCGYCQPGQIIRAVGLLRENPAPGREAVRKGMQMNLCRCGTYPRIEAAVLRAAKEAQP
jgi:aerobic-type carbon monoxide dehydrogenase small subunit (CoxS/CutS family)